MLGSNVPTIGGLDRAFHWAREWSCECVQIYVTPSRRWDVPDLTEEQIVSFRAARTASGVTRVLAHVPFLVNIASPSATLRQKSIARLRKEIDVAQMLGVEHLVLHPGSPGDAGRAQGLIWLIEGLGQALGDAPEGTSVLLETMAGQGRCLGHRLEDIASVLGEAPGGIGVCLDTAHLFQAGYAFCGYEGYERVMAEVESTVGLRSLGAVHVNDSLTPLASRKDRHAAIGEGLMGLRCFHALVTDARLQDVPKVLELPDRAASPLNLARLRMLADQPRSERVDEPPIPVQLALES
jgi:deoxyribonuclease IV